MWLAVGWHVENFFEKLLQTDFEIYTIAATNRSLLQRAKINNPSVIDAIYRGIAR
jgi:hypothetical protein